jgi:hypothetical protein
MSLIQIPSNNWASLDGSLNAAPDSPIPFPHLFNMGYGPSSGFVTRPPWKVPGVDYGVGIPLSKYPLQDPIANSAALSSIGCIYNSAGRYLRVNNNNTVLDGWDFSAPGLDGQGITLYIGPGVTGTVVQHCNFLRGAALLANNNQFVLQNQGGTLLVQYCNFDDGSFNSVLPDAVIYNNFGSSSSSAYLLQIYYSYFKNASCAHFWSTSVPVIDKYNLYYNFGGATSGHGNGGLFNGSGTAAPNIINGSVLSFRTLIGGPVNSATTAPIGTCEAIQVSSNNSCIMYDTVVSNNVIIDPNYAVACFPIHISSATNAGGPNTNGGVTVRDNYVYTPNQDGVQYNAGDQTNFMNCHNNIDLSTGAVIGSSPNPCALGPTTINFPHGSITSGITVGTVSVPGQNGFVLSGPWAWTGFTGSDNAALTGIAIYTAIDSNGNITCSSTGASVLNSVGSYVLTVGVTNNAGYFQTYPVTINIT